MDPYGGYLGGGAAFASACVVYPELVAGQSVCGSVDGQGQGRWRHEGSEKEGADSMSKELETASSRQGPAAALTDGSVPGLALVEQSLSYALEPEERAAIGGTLRGIAAGWARYRTWVPTGTEPAFVFHPTPRWPPSDGSPLAEDAVHD